LKQLQADFGTTFVYITHDQSEALVLSDHVAVMNAGRFEQVGTPQELYYQPATPFVAGFVGANNRVAGKAIGVDGDAVEVETAAGLRVRARASGQVAQGDAVEARCPRPDAWPISESMRTSPSASTRSVPYASVPDSHRGSLRLDRPRAGAARP
jgi:spermidine/putrescine transport system ATP-binding protein